MLCFNIVSEYVCLFYDSQGAVANKEGPGGPVPDRKPCLKVTMNLPTVNHPRASPPPLGPPGSSLKKAYQGVRDFEEITLTPMWDTTFNISLPIPKTMLKTIVDKYNFMEQHDIELTESEYQAICRTVLDWWSDGNIVVEVFDGERFNEDIFMGQVVILISSFLPLIKKHHELEIKGGFILEKTKPSQRVSGTIKLHAYLHVPEKKYIEDLLQSFVSSSRKQMMKHIGASREQNSHGHHRLSRVNSQKAVIVTDSEEEEVIPPKPTVTATSSSSKAKSQASKNTPVSSNRKSPASAPPSSASSNPAKVNLASKKRLEDTHEMLRKIDSLIHGFDQDESDYLDHDDDELEPDDFHAAHNPVDEDDLVDTKAQYVSKFMQSLSLEQKDLAAEKVNNSYINSSSMQYEDDDSLPVMNLEESENINIAYHRSKIPPPPPPPPATAVKSQPNPSLPTSNHKPATPTSLAKESKLPRPTTYSLLKQMKVQQSPGQDSPLAQQPYRNITVSSIVSEESARESSQVKRNFLSDMSKQLDNLSAIQQSADVVYDNLSKKLEEQRRAKAATTSPDSYDSSSSPAPPVQRLTPSTSNSKIPVMTSLRNKYPSGSTPKAMSTSSASSPRGSFSFNDTLSTMSSEDDRVVEKKVSPRPPQSQSASKSNYRTNHDSESDGRDLRRTVDRLEDNDTPVFGESEASLGSDYEDLLKEMEDPTYDDEDYRSLAGSNYDQQFDIDADYADEYTNKFTRNYHRDQEEESADDEVILIPSPQKQEQQRAPVISASAKARIQQRQADKYRDFNFSSQEEDEVPSKPAHVRPVSRGKITVPSYSSGKRIGHSEVEKTTNRRDYGYGSGSGVEDVEELYDSNEDILSSSATNKSNQVGKLAVNSSTSAKASGSGSKSRVVHKSTLDLEGYDML